MLEMKFKKAVESEVFKETLPVAMSYKATLIFKPLTCQMLICRMIRPWRTWIILIIKVKNMHLPTVRLSLSARISTTFQPWNSVFLLQQISISSSRRKPSAEQHAGFAT
jgi:hypothetical protein